MFILPLTLEKDLDRIEMALQGLHYPLIRNTGPHRILSF